MGTLLGFALGFYLGTKAGPDGIDELAKAWQTINESEDFLALSSTARSTLESLIQQGGASVGNLLAALTGAGAELDGEFEQRDRDERAGKDRNPRGLWFGAAQAEEGQNLLSAGAALVMQLLERGLSASRGRI
jgi:hypothetical protein